MQEEYNCEIDKAKIVLIPTIMNFFLWKIYHKNREEESLNVLCFKISHIWDTN